MLVDRFIKIAHVKVGDISCLTRLIIILRFLGIYVLRFSSANEHLRAFLYLNGAPFVENPGRLLVMASTMVARLLRILTQRQIIIHCTMILLMPIRTHILMLLERSRLRHRSSQKIDILELITMDRQLGALFEVHTQVFESVLHIL